MIHQLICQIFCQFNVCIKKFWWFLSILNFIWTRYCYQINYIWGSVLLCVGCIGITGCSKFCGMTKLWWYICQFVKFTANFFFFIMKFRWFSLLSNIIWSIYCIEIKFVWGSVLFCIILHCSVLGALASLQGVWGSVPWLSSVAMIYLPTCQIYCRFHFVITQFGWCLLLLNWIWVKYCFLIIFSGGSVLFCVPVSVL